MWVRFEVLWAVHLGGANLVGCQARVDCNFFGGETVDVGLATISGDGQQLLPFAGAVELAILRELTIAGDFLSRGVAFQGGNIQGALVEDRHVVLHVALLDLLGGHKLVDVLEARVIAGVAHHGAVVRDVNVSGLVLEAAHGRVLHRGGLRVGRVDLDHPAEAVDFVGLLAEVEALVQALPLALGFFLRSIEALQVFLGLALDLGLASVGPVLLEVLLARQERAPRGDSARAVIERAANLLAGWVFGGLQQFVASSDAANLKFRLTSDATVQWTEFTLQLAGLAHLGNLKDSVPVVGDTDVDLLIRRFIGIVVREHVRLGRVLMRAHVQQPVLILRVLDQTREVVIEAELARRSLCGLVLRIKLRRVFVHRVAPRNQHARCVARWHHQFVLFVGRHRLKLHTLQRSRCLAGTCTTITSAGRSTVNTTRR